MCAGQASSDDAGSSCTIRKGDGSTFSFFPREQSTSFVTATIFIRVALLYVSRYSTCSVTLCSGLCVEFFRLYNCSYMYIRYRIRENGETPREWNDNGLGDVQDRGARYTPDDLTYTSVMSSFEVSSAKKCHCSAYSENDCSTTVCSPAAVRSFAAGASLPAPYALLLVTMQSARQNEVKRGRRRVVRRMSTDMLIFAFVHSFTDCRTVQRTENVIIIIYFFYFKWVKIRVACGHRK